MKGNIPLEEDAEHTHTHSHTHTHTHTRVTNYHTLLQQILRCSTWWNRTVVSYRQEDTSFLPLGPVFRVSVCHLCHEVWLFCLRFHLCGFLTLVPSVSNIS